MSFKQAPIFTSGSLPRDRMVSQQFKSYNASGAPTSIGELRITMVNTKFSAIIINTLTALWAFVYSSITGTPTVKTAPLSLPKTEVTYDLSPRPALVVTVSSKAPESKITALTAAGFSKRTNGRYQYYIGPATDAAVRVAIGAGVVTDAFAPGNAVSVDGLITFSFMSRIIHHAFCVLSKLPTLTSNTAGAAMPYRKATDIDTSFKLHQGNLSELPAKGFFFPYFDGLLLPDNGVTLSTFLHLFSPLTGSKPAAQAASLKTFGSGWSSLANTIAGKEYSHMLYCIAQATSCGVPVRPLFLGESYAGCVFDTDTSIVHVGSVVHVPQPGSEIKDAISAMRSHDSALAEIVGLLNDCTADEENAPDIIAENITSSRHLHNAFRTRSIGSDTIAKIAPALRRLRFDQQLWDVTNHSHVAKAIAMICKKEFPDVTVPMNLRVDAVFSKKPIYSILGAFGNKAPSIRGTGSQVVRRISREVYTSVDKPGRLVGIPIFAKSHNEAKEDWESVISDLTVFFDHKGKDKEGKIRVKSVSSFIPFDTDDAKAVTNALNSLVSMKKRAREETEEDRKELTAEELARKAAASRRKEKGYGMLGLTFDVAGTSAMDVDADADEDIFA